MKEKKVCIFFILACIITIIISASVVATSSNVLPTTDTPLSIPGTSVVEITGINAVNFPNVITYVTVNTPEGKQGELTKEDFQVYENGNLMEITSIKFPDKKNRTKLDLAILFDETGSMSEEISDIKIKVKELTDNLASANIDCRYSLVSFRDIVSIKQEWTSDTSLIKNAVDRLEADGGDDAPEVNLDAIETALISGFRPDAQHMIIDITDSMTHYRDDGTSFSQYTIPETASHLLSNGTSYILVGPASVSGQFNVHTDKKELVKALGGSGLFIDIHSDEFSVILDKIQAIITQTYTISYYTPEFYPEGKKVTLEVQVGPTTDSGQFTILKQDGISRTAPLNPVSEELDTVIIRDTDGISTLGRSIVDITGINAVNFPYILTYVTVNTSSGRVGDLTKDDFQVYENGELMDIDSFTFTDSSEKTNLDLAIVFDDTGSLVDEIEDMKEKVNDLTDRIISANIDCRYSLITFKDTVVVKQEWTNDPAVIKDAIESLNASEGFDDPEVNLDAIEKALEFGFRPDAQHMILDITDSTTHYVKDGTPFSNYTIPETAGHLLTNGASFILVGPTTVAGTFDLNNDMRELVKSLGGSGLFIDIHSDDFSAILDRIKGVITQTYIIGHYSPDKNSGESVKTVRILVEDNEDIGQYTIRIT